jgi:hypothetical protein
MILNICRKERIGGGTHIYKLNGKAERGTEIMSDEDLKSQFPFMLCIFRYVMNIPIIRNIVEIISFKSNYYLICKY